MPRDDAKAVFARERRRRALARIVSKLRSEPDDVSYMLPFEEVVAALGRTSEHDLGIQLIPLESVVGTVDRKRSQFDRDFRPSADVRARWERIAAARRRGEAMPPIDVYRVGDLHFVKDGHHRVSVARAHGDVDIEARVREVRTKLGAEQELRLRDLPLKQHERMFHERVPLAPEQRARIQLEDEWRYAQLGMLVEAWAYRASHERGELLSRHEMAQRWFKEEYEPIVAGARRRRRRRRRQRDRALHAAGDAALPAPAHARVDRRDPRAAARRGAQPGRRAGHDGPPVPEGDALGSDAAVRAPSSRYRFCRDIVLRHGGSQRSRGAVRAGAHRLSVRPAGR